MLTSVVDSLRPVAGRACGIVVVVVVVVGVCVCVLPWMERRAKGETANTEAGGGRTT